MGRIWMTQGRDIQGGINMTLKLAHYKGGGGGQWNGQLPGVKKVSCGTVGKSCLHKGRSDGRRTWDLSRGTWTCLRKKGLVDSWEMKLCNKSSIFGNLIWKLYATSGYGRQLFSLFHHYIPSTYWVLIGAQAVFPEWSNVKEAGRCWRNISMK